MNRLTRGPQRHAPGLEPAELDPSAASPGIQDLRCGTRVVIRPARPRDEEALRAFYAGLDRQTLHGRFHLSMQSLPPGWLRQLSQVPCGSHDPKALVVATTDDGRCERVIGSVEWHRQADSPARAEFAMVVDEAWRRRGIGRRLVSAMVRGGAEQGVRQLVADVLADNTGMLALMRHCGFACVPMPDRGPVIGVVGHVERRAGPSGAGDRTRAGWLPAPGSVRLVERQA